MAHPHAEHRQHKVERRRVAHITKGYAHGGAVRHEGHEGKGATKKAVEERDAMAVTGKPARERMDRPQRKRGGGVKAKGHKGGNTKVNVIVAPSHPQAAMGGPMSGPMGGPPPMPPGGAPGVGAGPVVPPHPMGPPPGGPQMAGVGAPGMPPPGMPPRRAGGRTYAKGGAVKDGPAWKEGRRDGTQVQHADGKLDGPNIGRGRQVTFKAGGAVGSPRIVTFRAGGKVEAPKSAKPIGPHLPGGAGGGEARLAKEHLAKRSSSGMAP